MKLAFNKQLVGMKFIIVVSLSSIESVVDLKAITWFSLTVWCLRHIRTLQNAFLMYQIVGNFYGHFFYSDTQKHPRLFFQC